MKTLDGNGDNKDGIINCVLCGREIKPNEAWPHVDGDSNLGVKKIDYFCSEDHKAEFFSS